MNKVQDGPQPRSDRTDDPGNIARAAMAWRTQRDFPWALTTTSSLTMRLEGLTQSVSAPQTKAIDCLLDNTDYFFTSWRESPLWVEFRDSVWNRGLAGLQTREPFERGDDPVEDSKILPDVVPTTRLVANIPEILTNSLGLRKRRILVRSEYEEAEQAALLAFEEHIDAFAVTGQPGIGTFASRSTATALIRIDQERPCSYFGSSCDVSPSGSLLSCNSATIPRSYSTNTASASLHTPSLS
jgi:hypothetical protein